MMTTYMLSSQSRKIKLGIENIVGVRRMVNPTEMCYEDSQWRKWWQESCDELGLPYDTSFKDFTLALGKHLYQNGVSYPPNRAERCKSKRKKQ